MLRRGFWFAMGLGFGTTAAVLVTRRVERTLRALAPNHLARRAGTGAGTFLDDVRDAWQEGRAAMHQREDELRAVLPATRRGAIEVGERPLTAPTRPR